MIFLGNKGGFGIFPSGSVISLDSLGHLKESNFRKIKLYEPEAVLGHSRGPKESTPPEYICRMFKNDYILCKLAINKFFSYE